MGRSGKKKPKGQTSTFEKKPRQDISLKGFQSDFPVWGASIIDLDGPWGWKKIDYNCFANDILPKIQGFESMKWSEILRRNNHEVKVAKITKNAQKRLEELNIDDIEILVSLRLTGQKRIWGIRLNNQFKFLWWDPKHEVCPSHLKHT